MYWSEIDNTIYTSVTTMIHEFCQKFDSDFWSQYKALQKLLSAEQFAMEKKRLLETKRFDKKYFLDMYDLNETEFNSAQQDILDEWSKTNADSKERGTKIHSDLEHQYLGKSSCQMRSYGLGGSTLIFFNNTTTDTTMGISIINMYGQGTSATPDIPASSMVVYPIAGAIRNIALFGNSVIGSNTYVAFLLNNAKNMNYYSNYETDRLTIGTNQNIPVQSLLAVMCINNT